MIEEQDIIVTTSALNADVPEGTRGLVQQVYVTHPKYYLVEFMDAEDVTIDIMEVEEGCVELEEKAVGHASLHVGRRP